MSGIMQFQILNTPKDTESPLNIYYVKYSGAEKKIIKAYDFIIALNSQNSLCLLVDFN